MEKVKEFKIETIVLRASIDGNPIPGSWKNNDPLLGDFKGIIKKRIGNLVQFNKRRLSKKLKSNWVNGMEKEILADLKKEYNLIGDIKVYDFYIGLKDVNTDTKYSI